MKNKKYVQTNTKVLSNSIDEKEIYIICIHLTKMDFITFVRYLKNI